VVLIAGLYGIFTFSTVGLILGLIGVGIGGFNVINMIKDLKEPTYIICVELHSGKSVYIKSKNLDFVKRLTNCLHEALRTY
jgi:hypothetical protein